MEPKLKHLLLSLDLSEMDETLIACGIQFARFFTPEKIYLAHIIPNMLYPDDEKRSFYEKFTAGYPIDAKVRDVLTAEAEQYFEGLGDSVHVEILEGSTYQKLLELIETREIDLSIVGVKNNSEGSGITARRIARNTKSDILFVPKGCTGIIKHMVVPIDFSDNSARALKMAIHLRSRIDAAVKITAIHVVSLLPVDHYYGLSLNTKYQEMAVDDAHQVFTQFLMDHQIDIDQINEKNKINEFHNVSTQLNDYLAHEDVDLVVMGARGHSSFENFLYGSVTETFVDHFRKAPVLIVR